MNTDTIDYLYSCAKEVVDLDVKFDQEGWVKDGLEWDAAMLSLFAACQAYQRERRDQP